jgi:uncharacterized phiE125 gp8 family phage protein
VAWTPEALEGGIVNEHLEVLSAPEYQPVSLLDMRRWCRVEEDDSNHDSVLRIILAALCKDAENRTHRAFVQRSYKLYMDCWPVDSHGHPQIVLPFAPLVSVEAFQYRDADGVLQTLATDQYVVHTWREPGIIVPEWHATWPRIRSVPDALQISFTAGYSIGSPADETGHQDNVPPNLKMWLAQKALTIFDKRDQLIIGTIVQQIPRDFADGLLDDLVMGSRIA